MLLKTNSTKVFTTVFATSAISLGCVAIATSPSSAQNAAARGFYCDTSSGVPVTVYQNPQGKRVRLPCVKVVLFLTSM